MEFRPCAVVQSMKLKLGEGDVIYKPVFVIVNAGDSFNMLEELNRIIVDSSDQILQLIRPLNKVI